MLLYNVEQLVTWSIVLFLLISKAGMDNFPRFLETDATFLNALTLAQGTQVIDIIMAFFRITKTNWFVSFKQIFTRLYATIIVISLLMRT